jgi:hypothetical protein
MTTLKKRTFFYLCILILLVITRFSGNYISAELHTAIYIFLILIISLSIIYLIVRHLGSSEKNRTSAEKQVIYNNMAKRLIEKFKRG